MDYGTSGSCCDLFFQAPEDIQYIGHHIYVSVRYGVITACCNGILSFCKYAHLVFKILRKNTRLQTVLKHGNSTIQAKTISIYLSVHPSTILPKIQATERKESKKWNCQKSNLNSRKLRWRWIKQTAPLWFFFFYTICGRKWGLRTQHDSVTEMRSVGADNLRTTTFSPHFHVMLMGYTSRAFIKHHYHTFGCLAG